MHKQTWDDGTAFDEQETTIINDNDELEPIAVEGYYATLSGELIPDDELQIGTEIYYVLKTQNAVGKFIDLDLSDDKNDFKHNGKLIVNDILEDLKVTADTQKIKLQVIRQTN